MKEYLDNSQRERGISTSIYCIGVSSDHDATLLNSLTQAGSQQGNFIFIDERQDDKLAKIINSLTDSIKMAVDNSSRPRITLKGDKTEFTLMSYAEIEDEEDKDFLRFRCQVFLRKSQLDNLEVNLMLSDTVQVEGKPEILTEVIEVDVK